MILSVKSFYKGKIHNKKLAIKSLKQMKCTEEITSQINNLYLEIRSLKELLKIQKKDIVKNYKTNKNNANIGIKFLKIEKKNSKKTASTKEWKTFSSEIEKLKIRKRSLFRDKEKNIYGLSGGFRDPEKLSKIFRILIIMFIFALFMIPFWIVITMSTKTDIESVDPKQFQVFIPSFKGGGTINYNNAIDSMEFWKSIWVSLFVTIASNLTILFFASMAAWQLVRSKTWYSKIIFYIFLISMIIPFQAIMLPMMSQFQALELKDTILGIFIAYVGFGMALSIFMLHGFIKTIPTALEESASIAGMNPLQIFFKIVLPLLKPTFITILVLNIIWIWNDYLLPSIMLSDPYGPQTLPLRLIDGLVQSLTKDVKALSAGIVIMVIPPILYFVGAQKKMISGITKGSIK